jgi:phage terminase large subunit-like protein
MCRSLSAKTGLQLYNAIKEVTMDLRKFTDLLQRINLHDSVQEWHKAITEKFPIDGIPYDAWYTNRPHVINRFLEVGHAVTREIRDSQPKVFETKG